MPCRFRLHALGGHDGLGTSSKQKAHQEETCQSAQNRDGEGTFPQKLRGPQALARRLPCRAKLIEHGRNVLVRASLQLLGRKIAQFTLAIGA